MRLAGCNLLKFLEVPMAGWWIQHPCKNTDVISDQHPLWTDGKIQVVETISRIMYIYMVYTLIYIIIIIHKYNSIIPPFEGFTSTTLPATFSGAQKGAAPGDHAFEGQRMGVREKCHQNEPFEIAWLMG